MDGGEVAAVKAAPCPKSPPKYPDLCGRRRLQLEVQILNREIGFLEEELQSLEGIQPVSTSCKEVDEFVGSNLDPLVPIDKKRKQSCRFWKWLGTAICFPFSLLCYPQGCQKRIRCSYCYTPTNCRCSLLPEFCSCSPLRDCCCFKCQCQCPHCVCQCPQQCQLAECYCCSCCSCCSCFRSFCHRTSCCKTCCCGSSCCCCGSSSCFQLPSCRIPRCCTCTCDFSHSCCRQSGCCCCPLVFSCCRMPRCSTWDLTFCMPWRWLCCCFPLQCCCCFHGVSCPTPRPSCPDYSCGCIWSCPKCTETRSCCRLCSTKASCITGCLC